MMNRRQFMAAAAAVPVLGLPALAKNIELPALASKKVFWNLETFEDRVNLQLGELALVLGSRHEGLNSLMWHAVVANSMVMPTVMFDCRSSITTNEVSALQKVMDACGRFGKIRVYHDEGLYWPIRLRDIEPGTAVFVNNSQCEHIPNLTSDLRRNAYERKLALVVGKDAEHKIGLSHMRPADLVLTVEPDEEVSDYLMVNILKNRNGPSQQTFWYRQPEYGRMDNRCGAWF